MFYYPSDRVLFLHLNKDWKTKPCLRQSKVLILFVVVKTFVNEKGFSKLLDMFGSMM